MSFLRTIQPFAIRNTRWVRLFFVIFYAVGVAGLSIEITKSLFIQLVPLALILGFVGVVLFHEAKWDIKTLFAFGIVFIVSFIIESIGVATSKIFGVYEYGGTLGLKIAETPVIIGLNWLFLVYVTASVTHFITDNKIVSPILAAAFMVLYDLVLEKVAPVLGMWNWENGIVPLQNYAVWFLLALLFHWCISAMKIKTRNKMAPLLFVIQFLFFLILYIKNW
ncbi:MAG: carotenoid biosynthesis protein [Draconibacterium sp.]